MSSQFLNGPSWESGLVWCWLGELLLQLLFVSLEVKSAWRIASHRFFPNKYKRNLKNVKTNKQPTWWIAGEKVYSLTCKLWSNRNHQLDSLGPEANWKCLLTMHTILLTPRGSLGWCLPKEILPSEECAWYSEKAGLASACSGPVFVIGWIVFVLSIFVPEMKVPAVAVIAHITRPVRLFLWLFSLTPTRHQFVCLPLSNILYIFLNISHVFLNF